jgi:hypothetical protein
LPEGDEHAALLLSMTTPKALVIAVEHDAGLAVDLGWPLGDGSLV